MNERQLVRQHDGEVVEDRGDAADVDVEPAAPPSGTTSVRSRSISSLVASSCGAVDGRGADQRDLAVGRRDGRADALGDARPSRASAVGERLHLRQVGLPARASRATIWKRAVEAGPEALGEQVVGLARGRVRRVLAGVGGAEAQVERRDRERDHDDQRDGGQRPRARAGRTPPTAASARRAWGRAGPPPRAGGAPCWTSTRIPNIPRKAGISVTAAAIDDEHGDRGGDRDAVEEGDAEHEQAHAARR